MDDIELGHRPPDSRTYVFHYPFRLSVFFPASVLIMVVSSVVVIPSSFYAPAAPFYIFQ